MPDIFLIFFNLYLFLREKETEHEWERSRERGRHRIWRRLQALSCQHRAWCRAWTHKLWDHDLSRSQTHHRLSHPGAPMPDILIVILLLFLGVCPLMIFPSCPYFFKGSQIPVCFHLIGNAVYLNHPHIEVYLFHSNMLSVNLTNITIVESSIVVQIFI